MTTRSLDINQLAEPMPTLTRKQLDSGEARVATFVREYQTDIEDLWDACTNPDRLSRWYTNVAGDMRVGGTFTQEMMGGGEIVRCEAPNRLTLSLGGGKDEIDVQLTAIGDGVTQLQVAHATTFDTHEIGGQMFDAIYCMGGGYFPRFVALDWYLRGDLPADYDSTKFHEMELLRPVINRGMAQMQDLLDADAS